jgi:uncharacterized protein (TIGR00725 family)
MERIVTIFGSNQPTPGTPDYAVAHELGKRLAQSSFTICNGGYGGTMEAAARGASEAGGMTIGVVVRSFSPHANPWIKKTIVTGSLFERLETLLTLAAAYVVLKGGTGTLVELALSWEYIHKGLSPAKPIVLLGDFWNSVVDTVLKEISTQPPARAAESSPALPPFIHEVRTPKEAVDLLALLVPPS